MSQTKTTVVEISQQVISAAANYFALPEEDGRFEIILADCAKYVVDHPLSTDIFMIDGFHDGCQIAALCSQEFYNRAYQTLRKDGILVVNLLSRDKSLNIYLQRIKDSFQGHVIAMMSEVRGNLIVFAFKQSPGKLTWKVLKTRAKKLEETWKELKGKAGSENSIEYWTFVRRPDFGETVSRAQLVSFLVTYGYAMLERKGKNIVLVPREKPTPTSEGSPVSFPIPIPREVS